MHSLRFHPQQLSSQYIQSYIYISILFCTHISFSFSSFLLHINISVVIINNIIIIAIRHIHSWWEFLLDNHNHIHQLVNKKCRKIDFDIFVWIILNTYFESISVLHFLNFQVNLIVLIDKILSSFDKISVWQPDLD